MNRRKFFGVLAAGLATPTDVLKKLAAPVEAQPKALMGFAADNSMPFNSKDFAGSWTFVTGQLAIEWNNIKSQTDLCQ